MSSSLFDALRQFVPDGFRDDDGVWHDGPHRTRLDASLAALVEARDQIAQARRELWWFIETYTDDDDDAVARAISIQDDLLAPAITAIEGVAGRG